MAKMEGCVYVRDVQGDGVHPVRDRGGHADVESSKL